MTPNQRAETLNKRIDENFKKQAHHIYTLWVVNERWNHTINFFMDDQPRGIKARRRSTPLMTIDGNSDWELVEYLVMMVRQHTQISIQFRGWRPMLDRWPGSGDIIIRKQRDDDYTPDDAKPDGRYA